MVRAGAKQKWFVCTDASYEPEMLTGGLGGVLLDCAGKLVSWFGLALTSDMCKSLGGSVKETSLLYELELLAAVLSLHLWCKIAIATFTFGLETMIVFAMLSSRLRALVVLKFHLKDEAERNSLIWFARVPTEANISDFPSRLVEHPFLESSYQCNATAEEKQHAILAEVHLAL